VSGRSRRYAVGLWGLTVLFFLRVLGQALVAFLDVRGLPPMSEWYSGLLPYPLLLPIQVAILIVQVKIDIDFTRGGGISVTPQPGAGRVLQWISYVYALAMLVRWLVTWSHIIPVVFHWVLAGYLFLLGRFHATAGAARDP
jgi:hypothetical protein